MECGEALLVADRLAMLWCHEDLPRSPLLMETGFLG